MSYILTLVSSDSTTPLGNEHVEIVSKTLGHYNLMFTAAPVWLCPKKAIDIGISDKAPSELMHHLREDLAPDKIDVFCVGIERRRKKLLIADMDSTIVSSETLDDLAEFAGIKQKISEITAKAMEGVIDFQTSVRQRVALLANMPESTLDEALANIKINAGAQALVRTMSANGAKCVLVSGGFTHFTRIIAGRVGFDAHHGNTLLIEKEKLTGRVKEPIQDKYAKVEHLRDYCLSLKIKESDALTVGDGANDIPMLQKAGLGVGYHPKDIVKDNVDNLIIHGDLTALLYAQGYMQSQIGNVG